jgi:hypothetical protein
MITNFTISPLLAIMKELLLLTIRECLARLLSRGFSILLFVEKWLLRTPPQLEPKPRWSPVKQA